MAPPERNSVAAHWRGGYRCEVTARSHTWTVDEPETAGGDDTGPQPTELLLGALASCFALAIGHVAGKRGIELTAVDVQAVGTYAGPSFSDFVLEVRVEGDESRIAELLERARAVCFVSNTLARSPALELRRVTALSPVRGALDVGAAGA